MMKKVPPKPRYPVSPRKSHGVKPLTNEVIQQRRMSQDQRGVICPVGNVKRNAPRPIHSVPEIIWSRMEISREGCTGAQSPKRLLKPPVAPKRTSSSETSRPMASSDLRQKIRRPIPQGTRETKTSRMVKEAA